MTYPYDDTPEEIRQRIVSRMGDSISTNEGTFGDVVPRAVAYEIWRFYQRLYALVPIAFVSATSGMYLEMRCNERGLTRKEAGFASCVLTFSGAEGTKIPKGTSVQTADGLVFLTQMDGQIPAGGSVDLPATASAAGAIYNVAAGKITKLLTNISGITSVSNLDTASGGYDAETDEELYMRLDELQKSRATSGNAAQYEQWAMEVEGVGAARCIDVWDGPNTVLVVLASADLLPVSPEICDSVKAYIENRRPVGAVLTVRSAEAVQISIDAQIVLDGDAQLEDVKAAFENSLKEYLRSIAWNGEQIIYARVLYLLLGTAGVSDYSSMTINGNTENITLQSTNVPTIEGVVLHA